MRLNRENTLIENNLQPCSGMRAEEIQKKFVKALEPYKDYIDQFQAALLLYNVPLFGVIMGIAVGLFIVFELLRCSSVPNVVVSIIAIPILELLYCFDVHLRIKKLFIELPQTAPNAPDRIRSLEELVSYIYKPVLTIWRIGFFVYRTFLCPNVVDTIVLIVVSILLGLISRILPFFEIICLSIIILLAIPALLSKFYFNKQDKPAQSN